MRARLQQPSMSRAPSSSSLCHSSLAWPPAADSPGVWPRYALVSQAAVGRWPPPPLLGTSQWAAPSRNGKLRCCCQCVPTSLILRRLTPRLQAGDTRRPQRSQDLTLRPTLHDRADAQHDQHYGHRGRRTRSDRGRGGRCGRRGGGGRGRGRGGRTRVALALRAALNGAHLTYT